MADVTKIKSFINIRKGHLGRLGVLLNRKVYCDTELDEAHSIKEKLNEIHLQILEKLGEDDAGIAEEIENNTVYYERVLELFEKINSSLEKQKSVNLLNLKSHSFLQNSPNTNVKLPKINLPNFYGNILEWNSFWDTFKGTIDCQDISDVQKFYYLQSCLKGSAAKLLLGLQPSDVNYAIALQILDKRYGNKETQRKFVFDKLINLPMVNNSVESLRSFYDHLIIHTRLLENMGIHDKEYGSILCPVILNHLPKNVKFHLFNGDLSCSADYETLVEAIGKLLMTKEFIENCNINTSNIECQNLKNKSGSSSTMLSNHKPNKEKSSREISDSCLYCKQSHPTWSCNKVNYTEKIELIKKEGRCFKCLSRTHISKDCDSQKRCYHCRGPHHSSICKEKFGKAPDKDISNISTIHTNSEAEEYVALQVAKGIAFNPDTNSEKQCVSNILFDLGSQKSYITSNLKKKLELCSRRNLSLNVSVFGEKDSSKRQLQEVELGLKSANTEHVIKALVTENITSHLTNIPVRKLKQCPHIKNIELANMSNDTSLEINILIGADQYYNFVFPETKKGKNPILMKSIFGWVISGPIKFKESCNSAVSLLSVNEVNQNLEKFWNFENLGISLKENDIVYEELKDKCILMNGRYSVPLPLKENIDKLESHKGLSFTRCKKLMKRMSKNSNLQQEYQNIVNDQLEKGIIQLDESIQKDNNVAKEHFLPHHPVIREASATTKVRMVFDGSARSMANDLSLNDCLQEGPNLLPKVFDMLINFRCHPIVVTTDIVKAFLQIGLQEPFPDLLKFYWTKEMNAKEIFVYRFCRVMFGLKCSPFLLNAVLQHHFSSYLSDCKYLEKISSSFYVDDMVCACDSQEEAVEIANIVIKCLDTASFQCHKWQSNSHLVEQTLKSNGFNYSDEKVSSVLGVNWNIEEDNIQLILNDETRFSELTKRNLLSFAASIYDPLGLFCVFTINIKYLIQQAHLLKLDWDERLPEELLSKWKHVVDDLHMFKDTKIPRCVVLEGDCKQEIHGFCDASSKAIAAVIYVKSEHEEDIIIRLLCAKSNLAPLKKMSIPRLELMACLLLVKLMKSVVTCLPHVEIQLWSDSQVALAWIQQEKAWNTFVQNRVVEIRKLFNPDLWRFCPSEFNPADIPSRGNSSRLPEFFDGPFFLYKNVDTVTATQEPFERYQELVQAEMKATTIVLVEAQPLFAESIFKRFSSLLKLLRVLVLVDKFISKLRKKDNIKVVTTAEDLLRAESVAIRLSQQEFLNELKLDCEKQKVNDRYKNLNPFIVEDTIFIRGRLANAEDEILRSTNILPLLSHKSHIAVLIILKCHQEVAHQGLAATLAQVRSRYWITQGRKVVNKVVRSCVICKKIQGHPYQLPSTANLPSFRLDQNKVFKLIGIDFAGPLKCNPSDVYICLFTCANVRSVHIEIVSDLGVASFLLALRRFMARRGVPSLIVSDNAKTFKKVGHEMNALKSFLKKLTDSTEIQDFLSKNFIKWQFNVERAPWFGGFFERLIKSIKLSLYKVLRRAILRLPELTTYLCEVEACINSRPLTFVSSTDELEIPLTPAHFLLGESLRSLPTFADLPKSEVPEPPDLKAWYSSMKKMRNGFWNRWRSEYIQNLREHNKTARRSRGSQMVAEGDVVLVEDGRYPRLFWKPGRVVRLIRGDGGFCRACEVETLSPTGRKTTLTRSPKLLIPLECS